MPGTNPSTLVFTQNRREETAMKKVTKMLACSVLVISVLVSIVSPVSANSFPFTDVSEESEYYEAIE